MKFPFQYIVLSPFVLVVVLLTAGGADATEIRLKAEPVRCTQTLVALADIADIVPAPEDDLAQLRQKVLFTAPTAGETKSFIRVEIRDILSRIGLDSGRYRLTGAEAVTLVGEEPVVRHAAAARDASSVVTANYRTPRTPTALSPSGGVLPAGSTNTVSPAVSKSGVSPQLQKTLQSQVALALAVYLNRQNAAETGETTELPWNIAVKLTPEQARMLATAGQIERISGGSRPFTGTQHFDILMQKIDPKTASKVVVSIEAEVSISHRVVVLRRSLPKGYVVSESDVMLSKVDRVMGDDFFVDPADVIGKETVAAIKDRTVLHAGLLRQPTWVRKGDIVTVRARNGGIVVRTEGTALEDGVRGDTIPVATINPAANGRNKRARQESSSFLARVCEPKTVEINATASVVVR